MNTTSIMFVLTGLFVRLVIPLAITALIVFALHKLDAHCRLKPKRNTGIW